MGEWTPLAPLLGLLAVGLLALLADAVAQPRRVLQVSIAGLAACAGLSAWAFTLGGTRLVADVFAARGTVAAVTGVVCVLAALALLAGYERLSVRSQGGQIAALVVFATAGSVALLSAFDVALLAVALEIVALTGYALVSAARTPRSAEAAVKYVVQGAVAAALLAYGLAVLVGVYGAELGYRALSEVVATASGARPLLTAVTLLIAALAFKLGAFPFHSWAPDAYETADPVVAAFLSSVPKLAALVATAALLLNVFASASAAWAPVVATLAAASIVFGNLGALRQVSLRRMLAYSGIAQAGYALVGIVSMQIGAFPVVLFGVGYALAVSGAFLTAEAAGEGEAWDGSISRLAGLGKRRPVLAASLAVCLLSLTGIPLTLGFWGKFLVFAGAAAGGSLWLAVLGVIGSVVSFGYYGGVLRAVYLDEPTGEPAPGAVSETEEESAEEIPALVPRSVGALAASDPSVSAASGRTAAAVVAAIALMLLAGGLLPLIFGVQALFVLAG
jgi:NADH-quinone oxidoreductase subunit N